MTRWLLIAAGFTVLGLAPVGARWTTVQVGSEEARLSPFLGKWVSDDKLNEPAILAGMVSRRSVLSVSRDEGTVAVVLNTGADPLTFRVDGRPAEIVWNRRPHSTTLRWNGSELHLQALRAGSQVTGENLILSVQQDQLVVRFSSVLPAGRTLTATGHYRREGS